MKSKAIVIRAHGGPEVIEFVEVDVPVPLVVREERRVEDPLVAAMDWAIWAVFLVDYTLLTALAPRRWEYARRIWLHAAVILVSFPLLPAILDFFRAGDANGVCDSAECHGGYSPLNTWINSPSTSHKGGQKAPGNDCNSCHAHSTGTIWAAGARSPLATTATT